MNCNLSHQANRLLRNNKRQKLVSNLQWFLKTLKLIWESNRLKNSLRNRRQNCRPNRCRKRRVKKIPRNQILRRNAKTPPTKRLTWKLWNNWMCSWPLQLVSNSSYLNWRLFFTEQSVRDQALDKLISLLVHQKYWFQQDGDDKSTQIKNIRRTWEGLFYSKYTQTSIFTIVSK